MNTATQSAKHANLPTLFLVGAACLVAVFDFLAFAQLFDVIGYAFINPTYQTEHKNNLLFVLFLIAYAGKPIGGILIGHYGDKYGRQPALFISLLGMSICSIVLGFLPTYQSIGDLAIVLFFWTRLIQGVFFAGIYPIGFVYAVESLPTRYTGLACGLLVACGIIGIHALSWVIYWLENALTLEEMYHYGFRMPLIGGGAMSALLLIWVAYMHESPAFLKQQTATIPQMSSLRPSLSYRQISLLIFVLSAGFASIWLMNTLWFVDLASVAFLVPTATLSYGVGLSGLFMALGAVFFGCMADLINSAKVILIGLVLFMISFTLLIVNLKAGGNLALLYFVLTGFFAGVLGAIAPTLARLSPAIDRLTNFASWYNLSFALVGILIAPLLGYLTFYSGFVPLIYIGLMVVFMIFCSFYLYDNSQDNP